MSSLSSALGIIFLVCPLQIYAANLTVFAAASLTDSLKEIADLYQRRGGDKIAFNFGASSFLARQIEEGAPADIFFSADNAQMDHLEQKGLILNGTRRTRLSNSLVIVVEEQGGLRLHSPLELASPKVRRIALADPKTVPAGIYAKEYLIRSKLWPAVEPKIVPTDNVRAALAAVESGNVDAGMVYKTDAAVSKKVRVAVEIPAQDNPKIRYPMAAIKDSKNQEIAKRFLDFLGSDQAGQVFEKFGFILSQ